MSKRQIIETTSPRALQAYAERRVQETNQTEDVRPPAGPDPPADAKSPGRNPGVRETAMTTAGVAVLFLLVTAPTLISAVRDLSGPPQQQTLAVTALLGAIGVGTASAVLTTLAFVILPMLERMERGQTRVEQLIQRLTDRGGEAFRTLIDRHDEHDQQARRDAQHATDVRDQIQDAAFTLLRNSQQGARRRQGSQKQRLTSDAFIATAPGPVRTKNLQLIPEMGVTERPDGRLVIYPLTREVPAVIERIRVGSKTQCFQFTIGYQRNEETLLTLLKIVRCVDHWTSIAEQDGRQVDIRRMEPRLHAELSKQTLARVPKTNANGAYVEEILTYLTEAGSGSGQMELNVHGKLYDRLYAEIDETWDAATPVQWDAIREDVAWVFDPDGTVPADKRAQWVELDRTIADLATWKPWSEPSE